jgi:hypothetical protein
MKERHYLYVSIAMLVACCLQVFGLLRYIKRLPDDTLGIVLYCLTIIAFAAASFGFYIQWKRSISQ